MHSGTIADESAFADELKRRGWISTFEPGLMSSSGVFAIVCKYFDVLLETLALRRAALLCAYPTILPSAVLERLDYFTSFPSLATPAGERHVISPAICYHTYRDLEGSALTFHPYRVTAAGPCCRWEGEALTSTPERLWSFTMRELIFFGSAAEVTKECSTLERSLQRAFAKAGVATVATEATDPFFGDQSRGKLVLQRLKRLKIELRSPLPEGRTMAIASINRHEAFFTDRMRISFTDGTPAQSGCVAIGLERCAYAFLLQNGLAPEAWPQAVRRFVSRYAR
jgi:hypothetical protein